MFSKKAILPIFLLVQILLLRVISYFPESVEKWYSNGFFVPVSKASRIIFGAIPISVGDLIYFFVGLMLVVWVYRRFVKRTGDRKRVNWKSVAIEMIGFLSIFYFLFHLLWATNYYRVKLSDTLHIKTEYSNADLLAFTKKLIVKTNEIHRQIVKNDNLKVVFPYTQEQVFKMNLNGYDNLAKRFPFFAYDHLSIKKSLFSLPLTYMGFSGYLNPFTNEAQVNLMVPMYNFPTTATHEMAHEIGYASESEANFIGFLATINNDDVYFKYSGYSFALGYCLRNWEIRDEKVLKELLPMIDPGILKNYKESEAFWYQYETFVETGFKIFYDNFLKLNHQKDGLESYSKFVDLMVNYYKVDDFLE